MTRIGNGTELAARMLQAIKDLKNMDDARQVARYTVALTREIVPTVDLISFHIVSSSTKEFLCLGVYGVPHLGDTLHTPFDSHFGQVLSIRMPLWLKTTAEVKKLYEAEDDGTIAFSRHNLIHQSVMAQPYRNVVLQPCIENGELVAVLWLESWSAQRFSKIDIERVELISQVAGMSISDCKVATVHDPSGLSRVIPLVTNNVDADVAEFDSSSTRIPIPQVETEIKLTEREKTVLLNLVSGLTNAEIAGEMFISINTVRSHRRSVMAKLDAHSSAELIFNARQLGLIP